MLACRFATGVACVDKGECAGSVVCGFFNEGNQSCCPTGQPQMLPQMQPGMSSDGGYCTEIPDGYSCAENYQCKSGTCVANMCVSKFVTGQGCNANSECKSDACYYWNYGDRKCCRDIDDNWQNDYAHGYCVKLDDGAQCAYDWQCVTGNCYNDVCTSGLKTFASCTDWRQCASKACSLFDWYHQACCPTPTWQNWWAHGYCKNIGKGYMCDHDWQCSSDQCNGNTCT